MLFFQETQPSAFNFCQLLNEEIEKTLCSLNHGCTEYIRMTTTLLLETDIKIGEKTGTILNEMIKRNKHIKILEKMIADQVFR